MPQAKGDSLKQTKTERKGETVEEGGGRGMKCPFLEFRDSFGKSDREPAFSAQPQVERAV